MANDLDNPTDIQKRWMMCNRCEHFRNNMFAKEVVDEITANAPWRNPMHPLPGDGLCTPCQFELEQTVLADAVRERWLLYYKTMMAMCHVCPTKRHRVTVTYTIGIKTRFEDRPCQYPTPLCPGCTQQQRMEQINKEFVDIMPRPDASKQP